MLHFIHKANMNIGKTYCGKTINHDNWRKHIIDT